MACPLLDHSCTFVGFTGSKTYIAGIGTVVPEDIAAISEEIAAHGFVQITILCFFAALFTQLGICIKRSIGLKKIRGAIAIDIPLCFPVFREHGFDIVEHTGLDI